MNARTRFATASIVLLACFSSVGLADAAAGALGRPLADAARTCTPPHYPSVGYFTGLTVSGTSCATGSRFVLAYFKCRTKSGLAGRCRTPVLGFTCTETRESSPDEIDARDSCKHGRERIVSTWQQDVG